MLLRLNVAKIQVSKRLLNASLFGYNSQMKVFKIIRKSLCSYSSTKENCKRNGLQIESHLMFGKSKRLYQTLNMTFIKLDQLKSM